MLAGVHVKYSQQGHLPHCGQIKSADTTHAPSDTAGKQAGIAGRHLAVLLPASQNMTPSRGKDA